MRAVELFSGAGGLALGVSAAGFEHSAIIEWDRPTCATLRDNRDSGVEPATHWPLWQGDVRDYRYHDIPAGVELVSGGPPCQPFSLGGKHRGHEDERNMFPEAVRAVRELAPCAFIFENVKGLRRQSFSDYFEYIRLQLFYPELVRAGDEDWRDHLSRLERHSTGQHLHDGLTYKVAVQTLNAADFGVPQRRERVFFVGFRYDLDADWAFPQPSHSRDALLWDQWITGEYWERHRVPKALRPVQPLGIDGTLDRLRAEPSLFFNDPWRTVRDGLAGLPDPVHEPTKAARIANHWANPGARSYPGHTGSPLDEPAKTLKAGDHGVPGGENTLQLPDGEVRYFTVREAARLQTFPDNYIFPVSWTESMRQLGNAVPVTLAHRVAASVRYHLQVANRDCEKTWTR